MSIIAIDSNNEHLAGAVVYWRLAGDVNGDDLNNALASNGLQDHTVRLPTPKRAMRRAMQELATGLVFLRAGKNGDGGLYLVKQVPGEDGPEFHVWIEARLGLGEVPEFTVAQHPALTEPVPWAVDLDALTSRFWHHVFHVAATDISTWLITQAVECDALSMRDSGGVYFVPRHALDNWRKRADCLQEETTCKVYLVPALDSDEAVEAVMQALIDECTEFTNTLQTDLEVGELGERALETRGDRAKELLAKLSRYEALLGMSLDGVRTQLEEQQTNAIQAALTVVS